MHKVIKDLLLGDTTKAEKKSLLDSLADDIA